MAGTKSKRIKLASLTVEELAERIHDGLVVVLSPAGIRHELEDVYDWGERTYERVPPRTRFDFAVTTGLNKNRRYEFAETTLGPEEVVALLERQEEIKRAICLRPEGRLV